MQMDKSWSRMGRTYAWLSAEGFLIGTVMLLLLNLGIGTPSSSGLAFFVGSTWMLVVGSLFLLVGMLTLIPVGLALRQMFGHGARQELVATGILAGALLGASSRLLLIPFRTSVANLATTTGLQSELLNGVVLTYSILEGATNWLLYGWFLLTGLALFHASRLALEQGVLPRAWGWLATVSAIACWLVVILTLSTLVIVSPIVSTVGRLSTLAVGAILLPALLTWLGRELGAAARRDKVADSDYSVTANGQGGRTTGGSPGAGAGPRGRLSGLLGRAPDPVRVRPGRRAS